ncbi:hypothetical protein KBTX_01682 [wastewater metagenome]|uniref:Uncharacterized protein n=2 Tax=unclassified sequences TaxID=12908 RepID=A0A5B8R9U7_9ZZZZ|nr:hypothetical protein [Arhodomonas sp. KWT]QEA05361.1 hypothetical protein KBTEX_01682 [uncultured organism]
MMDAPNLPVHERRCSLRGLLPFFDHDTLRSAIQDGLPTVDGQALVPELACRWLIGYSMTRRFPRLSITARGPVRMVALALAAEGDGRVPSRALLDELVACFGVCGHDCTAEQLVDAHSNMRQVLEARAYGNYLDSRRGK